MTRLLSALLAAAFLAGTAQADYDALRRRVDDYQPPAFYQGYAAPSPQTPAPPPADEEAFRKAADALTRAAADPAGAERGRSFFLAPDSEALVRLAPARDDEAKALNALRDGIALSDLDALIALRNPAVRAARSEVAASVEAYGQAANLDEIVRRYAAFTASAMPGVGTAMAESVSTKFPFPGILALKGQVAASGVDMAFEQSQAVAANAVTEGRKAFWDLSYLNAARGVTLLMLDLMKNLSSSASARYEAGKGMFADAVRAATELATLREELVTINRESRTVEARLLSLLALPPDGLLGAPRATQLPASLPEEVSFREEALAGRRDLKAMRAEASRMELMIEMSETMIYPGFSLNLSLYDNRSVTQVGTMAMQETFATSTTASEGAGLPKAPWFGQNDAWLRETRQKLDALRQSIRDEELKTESMAREAWFQADAALREEDLYRRKVDEFNRLALDASRRNYEAGSTSFTDVLETHRAWLETRLSAERRRANLGIALAEMDRLTGRSVRQW